MEYKWARKKRHSFYFKGLEKEVLKQVIENRIQVALVRPNQNKIEINDVYLSQLLTKFKDDFRVCLDDGSDANEGIYYSIDELD